MAFSTLEHQSCGSDGSTVARLFCDGFPKFATNMYTQGHFKRIIE